MRNYIRIQNYSHDFFNTAYNIYTKHYPAFYVDYYKLDKDETVADDSILLAGSYEKLGVGELSGFKWIKILNVPVYGMEQVTPNMDSGEKGFTAMDSMTTSFSFPSSIGLLPGPGDFVNISLSFTQEKGFGKTLFVVSNFDTAHFGDQLQIYKTYTRVAPCNKNEVEKQISSYSKFHEPTKNILPLSNVVVLEKIYNKSLNIQENLNTLFNNISNHYLINKY